MHGLSKLLWQAAALRDDNAKRPRRVRGSRRRRLQGQQPRPPMPDYRSEKKKREQEALAKRQRRSIGSSRNLKDSMPRSIASDPLDAAGETAISRGALRTREVFKLTPMRSARPET